MINDDNDSLIILNINPKLARYPIETIHAVHLHCRYACKLAYVIKLLLLIIIAISIYVYIFGITIRIESTVTTAHAPCI